MPDKGSADEQIATLTNVSKLYDAMSEEYSVYIKPQNLSVLLYNGKQYDYFYDYEQSMTPAFFVANFPVNSDALNRRVYTMPHTLPAPLWSNPDVDDANQPWQPNLRL